jgi:hypothetical protein
MFLSTSHLPIPHPCLGLHAQRRPQPSPRSDFDLPLVKINIGLLADQVGVSSSNTLDLGQGNHDLSSTLDVGVEETENVLCGRGGCIVRCG